MKTPKKILFYIKDPNGGTGRFLENYAKIITRYSDADYLILTHFPPHGFRFHHQVIGKPIEKQQGFNFGNIVRTIINLISVQKTITDFQPDVIFSLDIYANLSCLFLKLRNWKIFLITSSHIDPFRHLRGRRNYIFTYLTQLTIKKLYPFSNCHFTPSQELRQRLIEKIFINQQKVITIPNPVDDIYITRLARKPNKLIRLLLPKHMPIIISICRFDEQKDTEKLIVAASKLTLQRFKVIILGDGPLRSSYQKIVRRLKLHNQVIFLGWQTNPYQFLHRADIFILVSHYECFPYSLLEALTLKTAIIASDIDFGPREILRNGKYGLLLKTSSPKEIAVAIRQLLWSNKKRQQLVRLGALRAKDFSIKSLAHSYLKLLFNHLGD